MDCYVPLCISFLIATILHNGDALKCYTCGTDEEKPHDCIKNFGTAEMCNKELMLHGMQKWAQANPDIRLADESSNLTPTCLKISIKASNRTDYLRSCFAKENQASGCETFINFLRENPKVHGSPFPKVDCYFCDTNACNCSNLPFVSISFVMLTIFINILRLLENYSHKT